MSDMKWIPVTEKLPEEGLYLVSNTDSTSFAKWWDERWTGFEFNDVIAWMPLPEPYRRWIPVTEALPNAPGLYLVSNTNSTWFAMRSDEKWLGLLGSVFNDVIAWMPLPPSYKGGLKK